MVIDPHAVAYDRFAWLYDRHWGRDFTRWGLPVLDQLLLRDLPAGARLLDLCCGTGHLAQALTERGYRVTGVDASAAMLRFARQNAPAVEFVMADARTFSTAPVYAAVVSTFDSLNHLLTHEDLTAAFRTVFDALQPGGRFVFDLNMEAGYQARWHGSFGIVEPDHVGVARAEWRPEDRLGHFHVTLFVQQNGWQRSDLTLTQRCYAEDEIRVLLGRAGFGEVRVYDAQRDFGVPGGVGRTFFEARRGVDTSRLGP